MQGNGIEINPDAAKVAELYCEQVIVADLDFVSLLKCCPFISLMPYSEMFWNIFAIRGKCLKKRAVIEVRGICSCLIPNIAHGAYCLALCKEI